MFSRKAICKNDCCHKRGRLVGYALAISESQVRSVSEVGGGGGGARGIFKSLLTFLSALEFISLVDSEDVLVRKSHMLLIAGFPGFNRCSTAQRGNVSLKRPYLKQFRWGCPQLKLVISGVAIKLFAQKRGNILELT